MGLLNALASGLSGAFAGAAQSIDDQQKFAREQQSAERRAELELARQKQILALNQQYKLDDEQRAQKPLTDYSDIYAKTRAALVAEGQGQAAPVRAPPVTSLTEAGAQQTMSSPGVDGSRAPLKNGIIGDLEVMRAIAMKLEDPEQRAAFLAQLDAQQSAEQQRAQAAYEASPEGIAAKAKAQQVAERQLSLRAQAMAIDEAMQTNPRAALAGRELTKAELIHMGANSQIFDPVSQSVIHQNNTGTEQVMARIEANKELEQMKILASKENAQTKAEAQLEIAQAKIVAAKELAETKKAIADGRRLNSDQMDSAAHAIASGMEQPLTGRSLIDQNGAEIMRRVRAMNPNFDGADFKNRSAAEKEFAVGVAGRATRSINVAMDHLHTLGELNDAMNNGDVKVVNRLKNFLSMQFGGVEVTNFDTARALVGDEIIKGVVGGQSAAAEREAAGDKFNLAFSSGQIKGAIDTYTKLLAGQLKGLGDQYKATTRKDDFVDRYVTEYARPIVRGLTGSSQTGNVSTNEQKSAIPDGWTVRIK